MLDGLSFSVAEGETVALVVGGIGSGKSTEGVRLMLRFSEAQRVDPAFRRPRHACVTIASLRRTGS